MSWIQKEFSLGPYPRGFHLVTREVLNELPGIRSYSIGLLDYINNWSVSLDIRIILLTMLRVIKDKNAY